MPYPDMSNSYAPMVGISGMGGGQGMPSLGGMPGGTSAMTGAAGGAMGGVSPFGGQPGMQSNQQFQDPNAWLTQMLQTQPGLAGTSGSPATPGATVNPGQAAAQAPSGPIPGLGGILGALFGQGSMSGIGA